MANKQDRFYFENLIGAAEQCRLAAAYLVECLTHYDLGHMREMLDNMHKIEHAADEHKHEMSSALARAFVTPIDREDLAELSHNIDDVADCVEAVLQRFYVDQIHRVRPEAITFAQKIEDCCAKMKNMLTELPNFKRPAALRSLIIGINHAEESCDRLYLEASVNVRTQCQDALEILFWREIYDHMEDCADACEHVADSVETIVMKNS